MNLLNYKVVGTNSPFLEITLEPAQSLVAETGAMIYVEDNITFESKLGDGTQEDNLFKNIFSAGKRFLAGESPFLTHFLNTDSKARKVAFGSPYPCTIVPIELEKVPHQSVVFQKGSFLCATSGTEISAQIHENIGAGILGGEGLVLQKIDGKGLAFIHAGGDVIEKELDGEKLQVEMSSLVGFSPSISIEVQKVENGSSSLFGGEEVFLAVLKGKGKVWLQSMPFRNLVGKIAQNITQ